MFVYVVNAMCACIYIFWVQVSNFLALWFATMGLAFCSNFSALSALVTLWRCILANKKLWENTVQEFGGICRRGALAGGKQVIDDFNKQMRKW